MASDIGNSDMPLKILLERRAGLYRQIRQFFQSRKVLEVETSIFSPYGNTDPHIASIRADFGDASIPSFQYAHTSPEFAMKHLLCAGSGSIYQLVKVFRKEEKGRYHSPEFTLLEWYRLGLSYKALAREVVELLNFVGIEPKVAECSYRELFREFLSIDPEDCGVVDFRRMAAKHGLRDCGLDDDYDGWLSYLLTHLIEPKLREIPLLIVYDFPPSQAALAKISEKKPHVALRFEVYLYGVELANGYQELTSAAIYRQRFEQENQARRKNKQPIMPIDERLLDSLCNQLPECSGVALGVDRLLMNLLNSRHISEVIL